MTTLRLITPRTNIAIIEDDLLTRDCVTSLLAQERDFKVVLSSPVLNAAELEGAAPDVILVDWQISDDSRTRLASALVAASRSAKLVATGITSSHEHLADLLRAGVAGFVSANATCSELISTIRLVAAGTNVMPPSLLATLARNVAKER
ncbi:MAG TPA: response regulator, partial [Gemmatimonadaceae bacterium]|nr:response regulator [Gemmatimonadaceae bacterium]